MFFSPRIDDHLRRAGALLEAGRAEEALPIAEEASRIAPRSADGHALRASVLAELGREEEALDAWEEALERDKKHTGALLGAADLLITRLGEEPESLEEGLGLCERGARVARKAGDRSLEAEFQLLQGLAFNQLGDAATALERIDAALAVLGPDPDALLERAIALFELGRFDESRAQLESIVAADPEEAWGFHYLGLIAERRRDPEAARHFEKARALAPEEFPRPVRLSEKEFDRAVEAALERLPEPVRNYLSNVAIAVEPIPADDDLRGNPPLSPTILGVFRGSPLAEKASMDPWAHFPSSIVLYQRNLERFARDREDLIEQIDVTLLHEVGHFLGFDEDDLAERGLD